MLAVLTGAWSASADAKSPLRYDIKKLRAHADKNGYISSSSEYRADAYHGTKNWAKGETELMYILRYEPTMPLQLGCRSCRTKDILPVDLANCRAEFVKMYQAVTGARPKFTTIPHMLTPQGSPDYVEKIFGEGDRFRVLLKRTKCLDKDKTGYEYTISEMHSLVI